MPYMSNEFYNALIKQLLKEVYNNHLDNYDSERFGAKPEVKNNDKTFIRKIIDRLTGKHTFYYYEKVDTDNVVQLDYLGLGNTYNMLQDQLSKELLVKIMAYRILGPKRVKFDFCNEEFWNGRKIVSSFIESKDAISIGFMNWKLSLFNLNKMGYPISVYHVPAGIHAIFYSRMYEHIINESTIKTNEGDIVIDLGGCWGDTALYFANESGNTGKVYTFEFIPDNLKILRKNLALNPKLLDCIEVIEKPIWDKSDCKLYYTNNGPGSRVSFEATNSSDVEILTISLDDFVQQKNISKIDFIKMDIEGAELSALKGAERLLKRFRPKLAISLYHKLSDFIEIPNYLSSLGLGYQFYLGHHTIHLEETVLYAVEKK